MIEGLTQRTGQCGPLRSVERKVRVDAGPRFDAGRLRSLSQEELLQCPTARDAVAVVPMAGDGLRKAGRRESWSPRTAASQYP